jgi:hypothetical protein
MSNSSKKQRIGEVDGNEIAIVAATVTLPMPLDLPPASLGSAISSDGSAGDDISQITVITENEGKDKGTLVRPLGVHAPIWDHFKVLIQELNLI